MITDDGTTKFMSISHCYTIYIIYFLNFALEKRQQ